MVSLESTANCSYIWSGWEKPNEFQVKGIKFSNYNEVSNEKLTLVLEAN